MPLVHRVDTSLVYIGDGSGCAVTMSAMEGALGCPSFRNTQSHDCACADRCECLSSRPPGRGFRRRLGVKREGRLLRPHNWRGGAVSSCPAAAASELATMWRVREKALSDDDVAAL